MIATPSSESIIVHTLGPYDILCGRCKEAYNNIGNRRFRVTINLNLQKYLDAPSRGAKGAVVMSVVKMITEEVGARFLKQEGDHYVTIDKKGIREKVAHAMRDMSAKHQNQQQQKRHCKIGKRSSSLPKCHELKRQPSACLSSSSPLPSSCSSSSFKKMEMAEESRMLKSLEREIKFDSILAKVLANAGMSQPETCKKTDSMFPEDDPVAPIPISCFSGNDMVIGYDEIFSNSTFSF